MILGILSDTHGDTDAVKRVYAALPNADAWAFLGDAGSAKRTGCVNTAASLYTPLRATATRGTLQRSR